MTDQELIDLHTIYAATTPGLWHVEGHEPSLDGFCLAYTVSAEDGGAVTGSVRGSRSTRAANARFIAAMHTVWPDLFAELQAYRHVLREIAANAYTSCDAPALMVREVLGSEDTSDFSSPGHHRDTHPAPSPSTHPSCSLEEVLHGLDRRSSQFTAQFVATATALSEHEVASHLDQLVRQGQLATIYEGSCPHCFHTLTHTPPSPSATEIWCNRCDTRCGPEDLDGAWLFTFHPEDISDD